MINVLKRYDPKKLNKDGLAQVKLFVYLNDERIRFNTGVLIKPNEWDKDKSLVRRTCKEYVEHNLTLDKQVQKINEIKFKYRLKDAVLTPDLLKLEVHQSAPEDLAHHGLGPPGHPQIIVQELPAIPGRPARGGRDGVELTARPR